MSRGKLTAVDTRNNEENRLILKSISWISFFTITTSGIRALREIAIAHSYGVNSQVDLYQFVLSVINWPISIWFSILTILLVPQITRLHEIRSSETESFKAELIGLSIVVGILVAIMIQIALPRILCWSDFASPRIRMLVGHRFWDSVSATIFFGMVISMLSVLMIALKKHVNNLLEGTPAAVVFITALAFPEQIEFLMIGTTFGYILHLTFLCLFAARQIGISLPSFKFQSSEWKPFLSGASLVIAGQVLMTSTTISDQFFASCLPSGSVATLGYVNRILALVQGIGALVISRATMPVFSRLPAGARQQENFLLIRWAIFMMLIGFCFIALTYLFGRSLVTILFRHGKFSKENTTMVFEVLKWAVLQIPFYFSGMVFVSWMACGRHYREMFFITALALGLKLFWNFAFFRLVGLKAIVLGDSLMYFCSLVMCYFVYLKSRRVGQ